MSQLTIENNTGLAVEPLLLNDADGRPMVVVVAKATFVIAATADLKKLEKGQPINFMGEYWGDPGRSSYKYEPETAFIKPSTDIVLIGHAHAQKMGDTQVDVALTVGPVKKTVRVHGDRVWTKRLGITGMSNAEPFERMPLIYERAFGGWDTSKPEPMTSRFEPRNPVGVGFKYRKFEDNMPLPNLEDPQWPLKMYGYTPPPAGFGFLSPHWQPRACYAGTYDERWQKERAPLLPEDFNVRFFNAASPGLIAPGYLKGNESVLVENASPNGTIGFDLPGVEPPRIRIQLRTGKDAQLLTKLDTVIINTDENLLLMLWRTNLVLRNGPHDIITIEITGANAAASAESII